MSIHILLYENVHLLKDVISALFYSSSKYVKFLVLIVLDWKISYLEWREFKSLGTNCEFASLKWTITYNELLIKIVKYLTIAHLLALITKRLNAYLFISTIEIKGSHHLPANCWLTKLTNKSENSYHEKITMAWLKK